MPAIVVMTTEILRNMLLQTPWDLDDVDCVIFDEIHYLADPERGTTWEESIILCPEHVQLICLSATVTNADEIAAWIGRTHRPDPPDHPHRARRAARALLLPRRTSCTESSTTTASWSRDFPHTGGELRRQPARGRSRRRDERDDPGDGRTAAARDHRRAGREATCCRPSTSSSAATTARPTPSGSRMMRPHLVAPTHSVARIDARHRRATWTRCDPRIASSIRCRLIDVAGPQGHRLPSRRPACRSSSNWSRCSSRAA